MIKQKEIWKDIPGYEGMYKVSDQGRVKSFRKKEPIILKSGLNTWGYLQVCLHKNTERKNFSVHQLVGMTFLGYVAEKYILALNHIDENKTNNNLENLEIVTNRVNTTIKPRGKSKYVGVSYKKDRNKWNARIHIDKKTHHLGYFKTEKEASNAYQKALSKIGKK